MDSNHPIISQKDNVFCEPFSEGSFSFDLKVATAFDDMIERSVPLYRETQQWITHWAAKYLPESGGVCVDLGCSTGLAIEHLARELPQIEYFLGVDLSSDMLNIAKEKLVELGERVELFHGSVMDAQLPASHMVVVNYLLQFLPMDQRLDLMRSIHFSLEEGGIVFVSEKLLSDTPSFQKISDDLYHQYKLDQGYSLEEIENKRKALQNVLVPLTENQNRAIFASAGFKNIHLVSRCHNFATFAMTV